MADAGSDQGESITEVDPGQVTHIRCGLCERWTKNRLEPRAGVLRCHFCGYVLWAFAWALAKVDGTMARLLH